MCTLTFCVTGPGDAAAPRPSRGRAARKPSGAGYQAWFNRDERRTRGPERPPTDARTDDGVRYVAPTDTDAGGTWIAANEFGFTVALLNGYIEPRGPRRASYQSRGFLVRGLANMRSLGEIWRRLTPSALVPYRPAVVVLIAPDGDSRIVRWDGLDAVVSPSADDELPIVSSSYAQSRIQVARRDLFQGLVADPAAPTPAELSRFQSYVDPAGGASAETPSMAREDAATRSQIHIEVSAREVAMRHAAGAPHETALGPPVRLSRRPAGRS